MNTAGALSEGSEGGAPRPSAAQGLFVADFTASVIADWYGTTKHGRFAAMQISGSMRSGLAGIRFRWRPDDKRATLHDKEAHEAWLQEIVQNGHNQKMTKWLATSHIPKKYLKTPY